MMLRLWRRHTNCNITISFFWRSFHTQTVYWKKKGEGGNDKEDFVSCKLISSRPTKHPNKILHAITVNDATRAYTALQHIRRDGSAVVYTGGDYHNARQLLQAIKNKYVRKYQKNKHHTSYPYNVPVDTNYITLQWTNQRKFQQEQSEAVGKILIQISIKDSIPDQITGLKRVAKHAPQIFAYAFRNDKDMLKDKLGNETSSFLLPLSDFLGMVGGYEWNRRGVFIEALQEYIYPHHGVFPPTRQDYIELLDNIDTTSPKQDTSLMEVGIGTGVLSIILLQQKKVKRVIGTDCNPYAIACAKDNLKRFGYGERVDLVQTDLFPTKEETMNEKVDIVLFNPPWIPSMPSETATWFDQSTYDSGQNSLRRFLSEVQHYVHEDGHVYLLLSNLGMLLGLYKEQALHDMFTTGNLELVEVNTTKSKVVTKKISGDDIAKARAQEVISLYKLRVKKV